MTASFHGILQPPDGRPWAPSHRTMSRRTPTDSMMGAIRPGADCRLCCENESPKGSSGDRWVPADHIPEQLPLDPYSTI